MLRSSCGASCSDLRTPRRTAQWNRRRAAAASADALQSASAAALQLRYSEFEPSTIAHRARAHAQGFRTPKCSIAFTFVWRDSSARCCRLVLSVRAVGRLWRRGFLPRLTRLFWQPSRSWTALSFSVTKIQLRVHGQGAKGEGMVFCVEFQEFEKLLAPSSSRCRRCSGAAEQRCKLRSWRLMLQIHQTLCS